MHKDVPRSDFVAFTRAMRNNAPYAPTAAVSADLTACGV
jgi:hypothetical protein